MAGRLNKEEFHEWRFRDDFCEWWRLQIWKSGETDSTLEEGAVDYIWKYEISKEDAFGHYNPVHIGEVAGFFDDPPKQQDFLSSFAAYISRVAIKFAHGSHYIIPARDSDSDSEVEE